MNPYLALAALVAALLTGAGGFKLGMDHQLAQEVSKRQLMTEAVDAANAAAAEAIAGLSPKYTTIQNKVQHEIETHTIYADCKLSPDGLQLANQALGGRVKPSAESKLPSAESVAK